MKRKSIVVCFVLIMFIASVMPMVADSADDYKVIKNAVKGKKHHGGDVSWFKLEVIEKGTNKTSVKIKVPLSLVDLMADCIKDDIKIDDEKCNIDFKKVMKLIRDNGPMTLIEIDADDCVVKIWFE